LLDAGEAIEDKDGLDELLTTVFVPKKMRGALMDRIETYLVSVGEQVSNDDREVAELLLRLCDPGRPSVASGRLEGVRAIAARRALEPVAASITRAIDSGSLSQKFIRDLAKENGLEVTQKAAVACYAAMEEQRERLLPRRMAKLDKCIGFLFADSTAHKMGA
jgi:hypothetical protein